MDNCASKKKILFFTHFSMRSKVGGAEVKSYLLADAFQRRGWSAVYVARDSPGRACLIEDLGRIQIYRIPRRLHLRYFYDVLFWQILRAESPTILYLRNDSPYNIMSWLYSRMYGRAYIHANTSDFYVDPRRFFHASLAQRKRNLIKRWLLLLENLLSDILLNFCIRRSDLTIVETEFQLRMFQEHFNASPLLLRGSHPLPPINVKDSSKLPLVLWIANMVPLKRPELFVQLARACQDVPASFILVAGKARPEYRSEIRRSVEGLANLTWLDEISLEESNELFARAALYINTSEYESIPNTFIQAWMRFTPTVSLNVDPDGVIGRFGLGRVSGDMARLIADVRELLSNPEERRLMGERARKHAAEHHDLDVAADRLEALFVDLLAQKGIHVANG